MEFCSCFLSVFSLEDCVALACEERKRGQGFTGANDHHSWFCSFVNRVYVVPGDLSLSLSK